MGKKTSGGDSDSRMISNIFDRAAQGLLKAPDSVAAPVAPSKDTERGRMSTAPTPKDLSLQPLDLSKITPALKNVKQVSPPAPVKIDLTGPGELPLDLSTKKRTLQGAVGDSGSSPPKKTRDSSPYGSAGEPYVDKCVSCRASRVKCCVHVNSEGSPQPAHQASVSHAASHLTRPPSPHHLNASANATERNLNSGSGNATVSSGNVNSSPGNHHTTAESGSPLDELAKRNVSTDSINRSGRYSPIELPKQRMTQTLKGQGIVNHRGRAFIVSPVRPQIKGKPVDVSSLSAITVKEEDNSRTQSQTNSVPSISTTLDHVVSCKPNFEQKNSALRTSHGSATLEGSSPKVNMVTTVSEPLKNHFTSNREDTESVSKTTGPLLNVPTYTPNVQRLKVKKNKFSDERTRKKLKVKKIKKGKKENAVTQPNVNKDESSQSLLKCENSSPESNASVASGGSSTEVSSGVRLPRHIMVARKSTRPHKPTRKVLEMVETSDILDHSGKHSPPKGDNKGIKSADSNSTNESTQTSPRESRSWISGPNSRTRDAGVSPELPSGKIRTVPRKFTRTIVPHKGRLGDRVTSSSSVSSLKGSGDVIVKRNAKKNFPVFMPTTSENESLISPLKLDILTTTSDSTFNPPVTDASTATEAEATDSHSELAQDGESSDVKNTSNYSSEPSHYSYPADTEPHHILSCPDWREDLIKYKRERLRLPPKIISVPKHTKPNFKIPTYVEIPKSNRLFTAAKKGKKPSPESKPTIKLTITGPSITMHEYPKGSSPVKVNEQTSSPSPVQKPFLNVPTSPEGAPKSPAGSLSNLTKTLQHKKDSKKRNLKLNMKHMSPLMKKVHKELKRERHRIASCSGRGIGTPVSKSPVRSESPGASTLKYKLKLYYQGFSIFICPDTETQGIYLNL